MAAVQIGIEFDRRLWVLKIGYDEAYARCSPGIQLSHEMIRHAVERGLDSYEFLGAEEPWQSAWPGNRREYVTLILLPWSTRGVWVLGIVSARNAASRVTRILRGLWSARTRKGRLGRR